MARTKKNQSSAVVKRAVNKRPTTTHPTCDDATASTRNGDPLPQPESAHVSRYAVSFGFAGCDKIQRFQDALLSANADMHLTDAELAIVMCVNHERSHGRIDAGCVVGIRRSYNRSNGGHIMVDGVVSVRHDAVTPDGVAYKLRANGVPVGMVQNRRGFFEPVSVVAPVTAPVTA